MENNFNRRQSRHQFQSLIKRTSSLMDTFLSKQFNQFIELENYDAAFRIFKQAIALDYPRSLINTWEQRLDQVEGTHRHPLESVKNTPRLNASEKFQLGPNVRHGFQVKLKDYFNENKIKKPSSGKIVEFVFDSLNQETGQFLVPDLTAYQPDLNLIAYSVDQYLEDCPDVVDAVKKGLASSAIDHFFRSGYFEIMHGQRYASIYLSYERKNYAKKILYIVDNYGQLSEKEALDLHSLQLNKFSADALSIHNFSVYGSDGEIMDAEQYLFQNISEVHNLCILLSNRCLTRSAIKWLFDIKLADQSAIFGYSSKDGLFRPNINFSLSNLLVSEITNGCIIVNSIEVLSVFSHLKSYRSAYGFYHALVFRMYSSGVRFILKPEVLSKSTDCLSDHSNKEITDILWSPFYWHLSSDNPDKWLLSLIRQDLMQTWSDYLQMAPKLLDEIIAVQNLAVDDDNQILKVAPGCKYKIAILIPFRDKIDLLENCISSLFSKKEDIGFTVYAINNNSCESKTFDGLSALQVKYSDQFVVIDSPGEFNYSKINNDAVKCVKEDYLLFLNNDILFESNWSLTTLLKTHHFYGAIITGTRLLYPSEKVQHNGLATTNQKHIAVISPFRGKSLAYQVGSFGDIDLHPWDRTHECTAVTAACMLIKKSDFHDLGGFNEKLKVAYNDVDLCLRAKNKYPSRPIICSTESKIIHLESESRGLDLGREMNVRLAKERYYLVNNHHNIFNCPDIFIGSETASDDPCRVAKGIFDHHHNDVKPLISHISLERIFFKEIFAQPRKDYACIFVHYDKDAIISQDCVYHIQKLGEYCDIYFVSSSEKLAFKLEELDKVTSLCKQILIRENSGYDFGCWSHVIRDNYDVLCGYEGVLLCNDSNWGPMNDFSDTFSRIKQYSSEADFFGLTSSITPSWHLQSFFILYTKRVFCSSYFKQHWFNIGVLRSKYEIVVNYEVNWSGRLQRLGFKGMSIYGDTLSLAENHTHVHWDILLKSHYPYLKKELLRDNPLMIDLKHLPGIISIYNEDWSSHIVDYLIRYGQKNSEIVSILSSALD